MHLDVSKWSQSFCGGLLKLLLRRAPFSLYVSLASARTSSGPSWGADALLNARYKRTSRFGHFCSKYSTVCGSSVYSGYIESSRGRTAGRTSNGDVCHERGFAVRRSGGFQILPTKQSASCLRAGSLLPSYQYLPGFRHARGRYRPHLKCGRCTSL